MDSFYDSRKASFIRYYNIILDEFPQQLKTIICILIIIYLPSDLGAIPGKVEDFNLSLVWVCVLCGLSCAVSGEGLGILQTIGWVRLALLLLSSVLVSPTDI